MITSIPRLAVPYGMPMLPGTFGVECGIATNAIGQGGLVWQIADSRQRRISG